MLKAMMVAMLAVCLAGVAYAGELKGVDLTSNETFVSGSFTPEAQTHFAIAGTEFPIGAFRGRDCGIAPDFEKLMRQQLKRGMIIPAGITLYNAGVTEYRSRSCGGNAKARLVGIRIAPDFVEDVVIIFRFTHKGRELKFPKTVNLGS